ncbi:hypothetical protein KSP39_PZI021019 [Platanthera zijinensis]|uniref:Transmembrane protein 230 n=1 Tax=Platanthera zijinensis TaxID=2320716 RepID=A0AAP0AWU9_9ASPA
MASSPSGARLTLSSLAGFRAMNPGGMKFLVIVRNSACVSRQGGSRGSGRSAHTWNGLHPRQDSSQRAGEAACPARERTSYTPRSRSQSVGGQRCHLPPEAGIPTQVLMIQWQPLQPGEQDRPLVPRLEVKVSENGGWNSVVPPLLLHEEIVRVARVRLERVSPKYDRPIDPNGSHRLHLSPRDESTIVSLFAVMRWKTKKTTTMTTMIAYDIKAIMRENERERGRTANISAAAYSFGGDTRYLVEIDPEGIFFAILGAVLFLPGFYYTRIAYYAYKGYTGFSFANIPAV